MNTQPIAVAIVGTGPVADLLTQRIASRADIRLSAQLPTAAQPPAGTNCVLHLPSHAELATGDAAKHITSLLQAGFNVVSTVPPEALTSVDLIGACRQGASTFHGSGGFQSSLITRFNRAFASITRNIRNVELVEELDIEDVPTHPWNSPAETGLDESDLQTISARANAIAGYYDAGLHTLATAIFGDPLPSEPTTWSATRAQHSDSIQRTRGGLQPTSEQIIVRRELGAHVAYDSIWTRRHGSSAPLRYRLRTTTADAIGNVTITFHAEGSIRPADHLTCTSLLNAIRPVQDSAPGILHHDLDINHVKSDDRL